MSVAAIATTTQAVGTPTAAQLAKLNSASGAVGGQTTLGENDFLQLLTVQLQNQDPLQPMSDTDFISQMATFSQLSAMNTLNTNFTSYSGSQDITSAQSYIGKTVTVSGAAEGVAGATGPVTGVTVNNGEPQLTINGINYSVADVTAILPASTANSAAANAAAPAPASTTPTTPTSTPTTPVSTTTPTSPAAAATTN
jgi:flagellar basal-body rod modification protein FlgD